MPPSHGNIVFDLDGTLVESLPGIAAGLNAALAELGRPTHPESAVRHMIGQGASNLCAQALGYKQTADAPADEQQALLAAFSRIYPTCWQNKGTLIFPGVVGMLMRLAASGAHMAVLSNKPHEVTAVMVRELFPNLPLSPVLGYQKELYPRKPDPAALHAIAQQWGIPTEELTLVGDSLHDAHTAQNAGCRLVLVPWGYSRMPELLAWRAEHNTPIIGSVPELTRYLMRGV